MSTEYCQKAGHDRDLIVNAVISRKQNLIAGGKRHINTMVTENNLFAHFKHWHLRREAS